MQQYYFKFINFAAILLNKKADIGFYGMLNPKSTSWANSIAAGRLATF